MRIELVLKNEKSLLSIEELLDDMGDAISYVKGRRLDKESFAHVMKRVDRESIRNIEQLNIDQYIKHVIYIDCGSQPILKMLTHTFEARKGVEWFGEPSSRYRMGSLQEVQAELNRKFENKLNVIEARINEDSDDETPDPIGIRQAMSTMSISARPPMSARDLMLHCIFSSRSRRAPAEAAEYEPYTP